jgi:hypothetical protein
MKVFLSLGLADGCGPKDTERFVSSMIRATGQARKTARRIKESRAYRWQDRLLSPIS